ncbi:MAG: hypothetical protein JSS76_05940 [Bacteroidetes bacterium]|nr:hypothetical protein [Bacteroidota bacterium]
METKVPVSAQSLLGMRGAVTLNFINGQSRPAVIEKIDQDNNQLYCLTNNDLSRIISKDTDYLSLNPTDFDVVDISSLESVTSCTIRGSLRSLRQRE